MDPEYERLIVRESSKEYEKLKESIKDDGLHYPIAINQHYTILDGHHRYQACKDLGIEPKIQIFAFANKEEQRRAPRKVLVLDKAIGSANI